MCDDQTIKINGNGSLDNKSEEVAEKIKFASISGEYNIPGEDSVETINKEYQVKYKNQKRKLIVS